MLDAGARVAALIKSEVQQLQTDSLQTSQLKLFVGHGAAFRHAAYHLGLLKYDQIAQLSMFHCHPVLIELQTDGAWHHLEGQWKNRSSQNQFTD